MDDRPDETTEDAITYEPVSQVWILQYRLSPATPWHDYEKVKHAPLARLEEVRVQESRRKINPTRWRLIRRTDEVVGESSPQDASVQPRETIGHFVQYRYDRPPPYEWMDWQGGSDTTVIREAQAKMMQERYRPPETAPRQWRAVKRVKYVEDQVLWDGS